MKKSISKSQIDSITMRNKTGGKIGIWLDHEKAIIVSLINKEETVLYIESNVEGQFRLSGGSSSPTSYGPQDISHERRIEEHRTNKLRKYYKRIIHAIHNADMIFIFGPGEAKLDLKKEMKRSKELLSKIKNIERADKMTEHQIAAKTKKFFIR